MEKNTIRLSLFYCNSCGEPHASHKYTLNERPDVWLCDTCDNIYWKWVRGEVKNHGSYYPMRDWNNSNKHSLMVKGYYQIRCIWDVVNEH